MNNILKAADAMAEVIREAQRVDHDESAEWWLKAFRALSAYEAAKKDAEELNRESAATYQQYIDLINGTKRPSHD